MTKSEEAQNRLENLWHYIDGFWQGLLCLQMPKKW